MGGVGEQIFSVALGHLKEFHYRLSGLIASLVLLSFGIFRIDPRLSEIFAVEARCGIYLAASLTIVLAWMVMRNWMPRVENGKIGIILAINAENEKQKVRVKADFAQRIDKLLADHNLTNVEVLLLKDHQSRRTSKIVGDFFKKINELREQVRQGIQPSTRIRQVKRWDKLRSALNGKFFVYGEVKERKDGESKYFISADAAVVHKPLTEDVSDKVKNELVATFSREVSFPEKIELQGFTFVANMTYLCARYIVGLAALESGDPDTALKLHDGLRKDLVSLPSPMLMNIDVISKQLDQWIITETYQLAVKACARGDFKNGKYFIDLCLAKTNMHYNALNLAATIAFQFERNAAKALKLVNDSRRLAKKNSTWIYNKAFLLMYMGKFDRALREYDKLAHLDRKEDLSLVEQCVAFNLQVIAVEPSKIQSGFIVGYLLYMKNGNLPAALDHLEKFEKVASGSNQYQLLLERSSAYIKAIKEEMSIN